MEVVLRILLPIVLGFALMGTLIVVSHAQPSEQYLRRTYGHRTVASATCNDVVQAVHTWGLQVAEQVATQYGMTPRQRLRAYACLRRAHAANN